jgi:hypothetical protein
MIMATSSQKTITTTSQSIVSVDNVTQHVTLHAKHDIYIGNEGVTSANGYLMDNGDVLSLVLNEGEVLYGVAGTSSGTLHILTTAIK